MQLLHLIWTTTVESNHHVQIVSSDTELRELWEAPEDIQPSDPILTQLINLVKRAVNQNTEKIIHFEFEHESGGSTAFKV